MDNFNIHRFGLVLKKDFLESIRIFLVAIFIALFILIVIMIFNILPDSTSDANYSYPVRIDLLPIYSLGLFGLGCNFAGTSFPVFRKKSKGIIYLSLPASELEKFLGAFLTNIIGFFLIYTSCFILLGFAIISIVESINTNLMINSISKDKLFELLVLYFNISALFLLGSLKFNTNPLFKTTLIIIFLVYLIININFMVIKNFENSNIEIVWDKLRSISENDSIYVYIYKIFEIKVLKFMFSYIIPPFLWFVAFLKFKEKEI